MVHSLALPLSAGLGVDSVFWQQAAYEIQALGRIALLLSPLLAFMFWRRETYRLTSVADVFLIAFALGFGFDLAGALLSASAADRPLAGIGIFPPFEIQGKAGAIAFVVPGYAYWSALVALVLAASMRFVRNRRVAIGLVALTALFVITEEASTVSKAGLAQHPIGLLGHFAQLTGHGRWTAWTCLFALVALSVWESVRASRLTKEQDKAGLAGFLSMLLRGLGRLPEPARLEYQTRLIRAEQTRSPENPEIENALIQVGEEIRRAQSPERKPLLPNWQTLKPHVIAWASLLVLVVWFAEAPPLKIANWFWSIPILQSAIGPAPTLICACLLMVLAWRYLTTPAELLRGSGVDQSASYYAEASILGTVLTVFVIVLIYGTVERLFQTTPSLISYYVGPALPDFGASVSPDRFHKEITTALLVLALAASALVLTGARGQWRARASKSQRRRTIVRNSITLAGVLLFAWISVRLYAPLAHWLYRQWGKTFFELGMILRLPRGIIQLAVTLFVLLLISLGFGLLFRRMQEPVERLVLKLFGSGVASQGNKQ